jgi:hypothetical protein
MKHNTMKVYTKKDNKIMQQKLRRYEFYNTDKNIKSNVLKKVK